MLRDSRALEPSPGLEPGTYSLQNCCSAIELGRRISLFLGMLFFVDDVKKTEAGNIVSVRVHIFQFPGAKILYFQSNNAHFPQCFFERKMNNPKTDSLCENKQIPPKFYNMSPYGCYKRESPSFLVYEFRGDSRNIRQPPDDERYYSEGTQNKCCEDDLNQNSL